MSKKPKTIGQRLQGIRKDLKLSPKDFADKLGLNSENAIGILESDANLPSANLLIKIAKVFKVDLHELLTGTPSPSTAVEVKSLRELKRRFRLLLKEVQPNLQTLQKVERDLVYAQKILRMAVKPYDSKKK